MKTLDQGGWRRSNQCVLVPPASLSSVVDSIWLDEWTDRPRGTGTYRIVADGSPHLIWNLHCDVRRTHTLKLVGARRTHHDVDISTRALTLGVQLKPGAIPALFGQPAGEFTDRAVPLASVVDRRHRTDVRHMRVSSPDHALSQMQALLERLVITAAPIDWRARWIETRDPRARAAASTAASAFRMCDRGVRAWSARSLGMGLKHFLRVRRLHLALDMRLSGEESNWSRVAAAVGYADHPHLVRDCRALLGESPSEYVGRADLFKRESGRAR